MYPNLPNILISFTSLSLIIVIHASYYPLYPIIPVSYYLCILLFLYPILPVSYYPCILLSLLFYYPYNPSMLVSGYLYIHCSLLYYYPLHPNMYISYYFWILILLYPILPVSYTPCILFQWGIWAGKTNIRLILRKPGIFTQQTLLDKQTNIFIYYYFSISRLNRTWNCNIKNFSFFP